MKQYSRTNSQLVAHCFFAHSKIEYNNYNKYYTQIARLAVEQADALIDKLKEK